MTSLLKTCSAAVLAMALPVAAQAADVAVPEADSGWTFTGAAYVWAAGIEGEAGVFGLPAQEADLAFGDILENLDFAFMGLGELRNGPFVLGMDLTYTSLGTTIDTPFGLAADEIDVTSTAWMVTGYGGYSLIDDGAIRLDVVGGARLWSVNTDFDVDGGAFDGRSFDDGATWVDPLVGTKMRLDLTPDIYVAAWGMVGGFGVSSDMMWDVMAGAGYQFNDTFSAFAGYRAVSVDYSGDGFVYDMVQSGPVAAAVFKF